VKTRKLLTESQYSAANLREPASQYGTTPVFLHLRNQPVDVRGILRVDRKFRSHGILKNSIRPKRSGQLWSDFSAGSRT
jgi:hypothetical protein